MCQSCDNQNRQELSPTEETKTWLWLKKKNPDSEVFAKMIL